MNLPEHLQPWSRFAKGLSMEMLTGLDTGESLFEGGQRLLLQSLYESGCLRRPETADANLRRRHIEQSRGQEPI